MSSSKEKNAIKEYWYYNYRNGYIAREEVGNDYCAANRFEFYLEGKWINDYDLSLHLSDAIHCVNGYDMFDYKELTEEEAVAAIKKIDNEERTTAQPSNYISGANEELAKRIKSIKDIGYYIYTDTSSTTLVCTAITAGVMMLAIALLGKWYDRKLIAIGAFFGIAAIIISFILFYYFCKKQYYIECKIGKEILVVGGFKRFRKYYVDNSCYVIKKGTAQKITAKKKDNVMRLFDKMQKLVLVKTTKHGKDIYTVKQKEVDFITVALGGLPTRYGNMVFKKGKFVKGGYHHSEMNHSLHFKVFAHDVKCESVIPQSILNLLK